MDIYLAELNWTPWQEGQEGAASNAGRDFFFFFYMTWFMHRSVNMFPKEASKPFVVWQLSENSSWVLMQPDTARCVVLFRHRSESPRPFVSLRMFFFLLVLVLFNVYGITDEKLCRDPPVGIISAQHWEKWCHNCTAAEPLYPDYNANLLL